MQKINFSPLSLSLSPPPFPSNSYIWHDCSPHVKELPWRILLMKRLNSASERIWYKSQSGTFYSGLFKNKKRNKEGSYNNCRFLNKTKITILANTEINNPQLQGVDSSCPSQIPGRYIYCMLIKKSTFLFCCCWGVGACFYFLLVSCGFFLRLDLTQHHLSFINHTITQGTLEMELHIFNLWIFF